MQRKPSVSSKRSRAAGTTRGRHLDANVPALKITRNVTRDQVLRADPKYTWADNGLPPVRKLRLTPAQKRIAKLPAYMR